MKKMQQLIAYLILQSLTLYYILIKFLLFYKVCDENITSFYVLHIINLSVYLK